MCQVLNEIDQSQDTIIIGDLNSTQTSSIIQLLEGKEAPQDKFYRHVYDKTKTIEMKNAYENNTEPTNFK